MLLMFVTVDSAKHSAQSEFSGQHKIAGL